MTVIYEFSKCHQAAGGQTTVLVADQTRHDYDVGQCIEFPIRPLPDKKRKLVDAGLGMLGLARPFDNHFYRPALQSLPADFDGVILLHNAAGAVRAFARKFGRARVYLWPHNDLFGTYTQREVRRTIAAATGVICVSQFIANGLLKQLGGVMKEKLLVVNNGVDIERFRPRPGPAPAGDPVILFVGRVTDQKAPDLILRAAAKIATPERQFKVRIVGNSGFSAKDPLTPYEHQLRELARPLGDRVEFQSFVDRRRVIEEFDRASIYCVPSNWDDPCPLTVGEGLGSGLPCVLSRRGGIPEMAGDAALYFESGRVDQLAAHLADLVDDPDKRTAWGQKARQRALEISWPSQYQVLRNQLAR